LRLLAGSGYAVPVPLDSNEAPERSSGPLGAEISTAFVRLLKEHAGKGPPHCRTYVEEDVIVVLLRGGYTALETELFEDGKWLDVRSMRHAFHDTMEGRFTAELERLTGREVQAFMSASHQAPDLQVEVFVLEAEHSEPVAGV
jgi:uncharacterized protein YbcI